MRWREWAAGLVKRVERVMLYRMRVLCSQSVEEKVVLGECGVSAARLRRGEDPRHYRLTVSSLAAF